MTPIAIPENPYKRHLDAYRRAYDRSKRVKLHHDAAPEQSTVSDDSALIPTSLPDDNTEATEIESDLSSEVSDSSEEPSDEASSEEDDDDEAEDEKMVEDEAEVVNLRVNRGEKPVMKFGDEGMGDDIRPFLKSFLPQLKAANEELEAQKAAGTLETAEVVEGEGADNGEEAEQQYIEMNLGLGVLETKDADASSSSDSEDDENEDGAEGQAQEKDIMATLMGQSRDAAGVQVVDDEEIRGR